MEIKEAKILLNRYYEGLATIDEERQLAEFVTSYVGEDSELNAARLMFGAFKTMREETIAKPIEVRHHRNIFSLRRVVAYAAACAAVAVVVFVGLSPRDVVEEPALVCHINGVLVDDELVAQAEASKILSSVFADVNNAVAEVSRITGYTNGQ